MSRKRKKRSIQVDRATARYANIVSIDPELDFGEGLSARAFGELIANTRQALSDYNTLLADLDSAYDTFRVLEKSLVDMSSRMLSGIASRYGKESIEYKKSGGTRPSERRKSSTLPSSPSATA